LNERKSKKKGKRLTFSIRSYLPAISLPRGLMPAKKLFDEGEVKKALQFLDKFEQKRNIIPEDRLSCQLFKIYLLIILNRFDDAIKFAEMIYQKNQKLSKDLQFLDVLILHIFALQSNGEWNKIVSLIEQGENLIKSYKGEFSTDILQRESILIRLKGNILVFKGDINFGIECTKQSLMIAEKINDRGLIVACLYNLSEYYNELGDFNSALKHIDRSLKIFDDNSVDLLLKVSILNDAVEYSINMGDLEHARQYLQHLKQIKNREDSEAINAMYRFTKAIMLKRSPRVMDLGKSEKMLKHLLEEKIFNFEYTVRTVIHLCDLLVSELRLTSNLEVLDEIKFFISQLLEISEDSKAYRYLCETSIFQAKLALLELDMKTAQRYLTQAQQIAERFSFGRLEKRIAYENEDLLKNLNSWEKLKELEAPIADRLELARLNEQIGGMLQHRSLLTAQVTEERISISKETKICLVCRGEVLRFTYICECGAIYCENCARAVTDLENICWVCDVPIDYSKPTKQIEEEREELHKSKNNLKK